MQELMKKSMSAWRNEGMNEGTRVMKGRMKE